MITISAQSLLTNYKHHIDFRHSSDIEVEPPFVDLLDRFRYRGLPVSGIAVQDVTSLYDIDVPRVDNPIGIVLDVKSLRPEVFRSLRTELQNTTGYKISRPRKFFPSNQVILEIQKV